MLNLFRYFEGYMYSDLHFFLRNRSFRFGEVWSFSILYINIDLFRDLLTLSVSQPRVPRISADLTS